MSESSSDAIDFPVLAARDALDEMLRAGAQRVLAQSIEAGVAERVERHAHSTN